jgi:hypothetical protein
MKSYIILPNKFSSELPDEFKDDDNRFPESLVELFLKEYTKPGDNVLDIFAGFGTTLVVSERMKRVGYGIEYNQRRCDYAKSRLINKENLICGDTRHIGEYHLPEMDFVLCSPIYMNKDWNMNPLSEDRKPGTYFGYLDELQAIFSKLKSIVKSGCFIVVEVANLKSNIVTTFAWDVCRALSRELLFEREIVVCWEGPDLGQGAYGCGYDHSYCLIFRNSFD